MANDESGGKMDYESKTPRELWSLAWRGSVTDRELYFTMSELVLKYNKYPSGTFFPPKSGPFLLDLLEETHEPQLKIVACTLIGYLCNVTSTAKEDLAKRGAIDLLLRIIELGLPEKEDSTEVHLLRMLFEHVTSMLQFFSLGPDLCLRKMSVTDALGVIGQLIDTDNPTMYGYDSPSTLQKLVEGRLLVAERFDMTPSAASVVLYRQLGFDFKSRFHISDSYVVDLYDTNGEDDVRIVDELDRRSKFTMLYGSREDECEIEDVTKFVVVDVKVTFCLSSAYFWAVLGHENIDMLSDFESDLLDGGRFLGLGRTPSVGQMVGAVREDGSVYRAQVLLVDEELVTLFAIDYGFVKVVPVQELKAIGCEVKFQTEGLARLCKVLGLRRMPICPEITKNLLLTLCNLTSDLSTGMAERVLSMNLLPSLNHLSTYPDVRLSICVIQVLSNMAHNVLLKANFVHFGIIDSIIGMVRRNMSGLSRSATHNPDCDQLIESCVVLFWNLIYNHQTNKEELVKRGGIHLVTELTGTDKPESVRQTALKTLRVFVDRVAVSTYKNHRRPREDLLESTTDVNQSDSDAASDSSGETKLLSLSLNSYKGDEKMERIRVLQKTAKDATVEYIQGEKTFLRTADDCELLMHSVDAVSENAIARIICGFLNRWSEGGSVYFGVKKHGLVEGQLVSHSDRDRFRLCIDKLTIKKFSPAVPAGVVSTLFHPVLDTEEDGQCIVDCFVIEIRVKPTLASTLYGFKHTGEPKQFVRMGMKTVEMTAKDVYAWTIEMCEESKLKELRQLQHEVEQLRRIRSKMSKD